MDEAVISIGMLDSLNRMLEEQFNSIGGTTGRRLFIVVNGVVLTGKDGLFKLGEAFLIGVCIR